MKTTKQHRLWWQSSYDRGIQHLLKMWPEIKKQYPDAELWIAYGFQLFDAAYNDNKERQNWKQQMLKLMEMDGITHLGRLGKEELQEKRRQCGIWSYPTDFSETNCIGALDCQLDGVVPCVMNKAGLRESVQSGVRIEGDISDSDVSEEYLKQLLLLMGDKKAWEKHQEDGVKWAEGFKWPNIAASWAKHFNESEVSKNART